MLVTASSADSRRYYPCLHSPLTSTNEFSTSVRHNLPAQPLRLPNPLLNEAVWDKLRAAGIDVAFKHYEDDAVTGSGDEEWENRYTARQSSPMRELSK
jgi:hypothetical protein